MVHGGDEDKSREDRENDTEEVIEWRSMGQEEMDACWKRPRRWRKRFWTSTRWRTAKEVLTEAEAPFWNGGVYEEAGSTEHESEEKIVGQEFSSCSRDCNLQRLQSMHEDSTEGEKMKRQQRMKVMKDMTRKIGSKGRIDAENRWWVAELLVADCEKAWLHPREEETVQKCLVWWEK